MLTFFDSWNVDNLMSYTSPNAVSTQGKHRPSSCSQETRLKLTPTAKKKIYFKISLFIILKNDHLPFQLLCKKIF